MISIHKKRENLIRAFSLLSSVESDSNIHVSDLIIYDNKKIITQTIHQIADQIEELENPPLQIVEFIDNLSLKIPKTPSTTLKSYK